MWIWMDRGYPMAYLWACSTLSSRTSRGMSSRVGRQPCTCARVKLYYSRCGHTKRTYGMEYTHTMCIQCDTHVSNYN